MQADRVMCVVINQPATMSCRTNDAFCSPRPCLWFGAIMSSNVTIVYCSFGLSDLELRADENMCYPYLYTTVGLFRGNVLLSAVDMYAKLSHHRLVFSSFLINN